MLAWLALEAGLAADLVLPRGGVGWLVADAPLLPHPAAVAAKTRVAATYRVLTT